MSLCSVVFFFTTEATEITEVSGGFAWQPRGAFRCAAVWRFRVFYPLTPGPSPPLGARGGFSVFVVVEADVAPLSPVGGEGRILSVVWH
jgi:hypothetical protein